MNFGIIAAGEGSRLCSEGVATPKPLVEIAGVPMIQRLLEIFHRAGAKRVAVCINDFMPEVKAFLNNYSVPEDMEILLNVQSTPSSMHTFKVISENLRGHGRFITTTVDTIFKEEDFLRYARAWENAPEGVNSLMAVTDFVDDEKPLWIETLPEEVSSNPEILSVSGFLDCETPRTHFISGGIYGLDDSCISVLDDCLAKGKSRMRNFQRALVEKGLNVCAMPIGKVMDIDHASDIAKANDFLSNN